MKKLALSIVLLSGLFLLSGCWNTSTDTSTSDNEANSNQTSEETLTTSMSKLFKEWKPSTCTFTLPTEDWVTLEWTLYVDGKKMRYTSQGTIAWQSMEMNVIVKDDYSYSWSNMEQGKWYKMKELADDMQEDAWEDVWAEEREQEMDFVCKKWVKDWIFDLPNNITFTEFNADNFGM